MNSEKAVDGMEGEDRGNSDVERGGTRNKIEILCKRDGPHGG